MRLRKIFRLERTRRYPINRDERGLSMRARCFERFNQGQQPIDVAASFGFKVETVRRYYADWKSRGANFDKQFAYAQELFKKTSHERKNNIQSFAKMLEVKEEEFESLLEKPHGLKRFMTRKLNFPIMIRADHKRSIALQLGLLLSEHLVDRGGKYEDVYLALQDLLDRNMMDRQDDEEAIESHNQIMAVVHKIIDADLRVEQNSAVKPDRLSADDVNVVVEWKLNSLMKTLEISYWENIATLTSTGLTKDQAREKMVQDLIDKGDLAGAKARRAYQKIVHPVKSLNQTPPQQSSHQPASD
jgi:hypothetical protein